MWVTMISVKPVSLCFALGDSTVGLARATRAREVVTVTGEERVACLAERVGEERMKETRIVEVDSHPKGTGERKGDALRGAGKGEMRGMGRKESERGGQVVALES